MRYRGKGLNKEMWFSICSMHLEHKDDCNMCNAGHWQKVWKYKLSRAFYKLSPKLWRCWINK